nr:amidohydrolase family protein [Candidatus Cloacimonadota bacterium]
MQTTDLFIKNGLILTYDREPFVGSLAVQAGKIIDLGATAQLEQKYLPTETLDATGKIVMPGFVNTHTHVAMSYFKGLADDLPLMVWLSQHIWPREAHFVNPEFVKDSTLHGCAEMIRNGVTTFNDMYFYSDEAAQSAQKAGIRAVLGETVLDHPIVNCHNADEVLAYILKLDNKYKNNSLIDISVAPHAIYTCSKENLIKAKDFAQKHGLLLHIHLSETRQEVEDSQKNFGMRPAEYLDSIGFFESRVVAAH